MRRVGVVLGLALAGGLLPVGSARAEDPEPGTPLVVTVAADADAAAVAAEVAASGAEVERVVGGETLVVTGDDQAALAAVAGVEAVEEDNRIAATDVRTGAPWGVDRTDQRTRSLDGTYRSLGTGSGSVIYVVDSGLRADHVELTGRVLPGVGYLDRGTPASTDDCDGHGTHVTGIAAGATLGMAPGAKVVPVRVLDCEGYGWESDLLAGLDWILADHAGRGRPPAVVNLSLGGPPSNAVDTRVTQLVAAGLVVVTGAGNSNTDACGVSPARAPRVVTVGATTSGDARASFSNYGPCLDLFAPGVAITSAWNSAPNATAAVSGTSMAAPHVAGAAAVLLARARSAGQPMSADAAAAVLVAAATAGRVGSEGSGSPDRLLFAPPGGFVGIAPGRLFDTRAGQPAARRVATGPIPTGTVFEVPVVGAAGVPGGVAAVSFNVTVTEPQAPGFLTVYPCGTRPTASSLNFEAGQTVANAVLTALSARGSVCFFASAPIQLLADVNGWVPTGSEGTRLTTPVRLFDTRPGLPGLRPVAKRRVAPNEVIELDLRGVAGINPGSSRAVVMNVTATEPLGSGFVTVYPCGPVPLVSSLNMTAGRTVPNMVIVPLSSRGTVCLRASVATHLLADVVGSFGDGTGALGAVAPTRVFDTRGQPALLSGFVGRIAPGGVLEVSFAGLASVPAEAGSVSLNLTATEALGPGFVTAFPCGPRPLASSLNVTAGATVPNAVIVPLSPRGTVCFFSSTATSLLGDVNGWFPG